MGSLPPSTWPKLWDDEAQGAGAYAAYLQASSDERDDDPWSRGKSFEYGPGQRIANEAGHTVYVCICADVLHV